jgi:hypothetical protein
MTATLTKCDAKARFEAEGYLTPIEIMSPAEMTPYQEEFDRLEMESGKETSQVGLFGLHKTRPLIWELVSHPRVLASVSEVLGPNLLLLGSHFFCKQPGLSESYVSWHQDVTYWGLNPPMAATLWLSIDGADVENGCMRIIPRSHLAGLLPHGKAQVKGNLLSVNQEIPSDLVDETSAVDIELPAGSASLHHGMTIHGSNPNRSSRRRCGLTMRFITPEVKPVGEEGARWRPILMHGEDLFHHFPCDPIPTFVS